MLDFDNVGLEEIKYWAFEVMKKAELCGYVILESSYRHYHVVFDRKVSWAENMSIIAWLCLELKHEEFTKWFLLQCIKKELTLRVSSKGEKPPPKLIYRRGNQNGRIRKYLQYRSKIKGFMRKVSETKLDQELEQ
jgi:hypothetical protein